MTGDKWKTSTGAIEDKSWLCTWTMYQPWYKKSWADTPCADTVHVNLTEHNSTFTQGLSQG